MKPIYLFIYFFVVCVVFWTTPDQRWRRTPSSTEYYISVMLSQICVCDSLTDKLCKSPREMFPAQFFAQVLEPSQDQDFNLSFCSVSFPFFPLPRCSSSSQSDTDLTRYKPQLIMEWDEKGTPVMLITLINGRLARRQKGTTAALSRSLLLIINIKDFCLSDSQSDAWKPAFVMWAWFYEKYIFYQ